ncbi:MAG: Gfo/Idh/MocA family oxidoreductase [Clostridia bacterium]|nr:Gfo/Idh/MocA family oxidoreductase [Clostridia bacterium]
MKTVKMGMIGLGQRGLSMLKSILLKMEDVEIVAVCDEYADRTEQAACAVERATGKRPFASVDYADVLRLNGLDAVYVATSWETHVEIGTEAMKNGVAVALEVGGAYSLQSLWSMVHMQEQTGTPLMLMENCCFGKDELLATSMARRGLFGEIVHCHGAYAHYLAEEVARGEEIRHYRLRNYLTRNCENYPTHELGPIAKLLNINRGNRMLSLVSVASKAVGMEDYVARRAEQFPHLVGKRFRQGDIVNTLITCADGSTVSLRLDTTLPRSYSREFTVRGTRGMYEQTTNTVFLEGDRETFDTHRYYRENFGNAARFEADYLPPVWREMTEETVKAGHGGMDAIEFRVFVDCLKANQPMPIDVYDAAAWMAVTALSEASVAAGGLVQAVPDFTGGMWTRRKPLDVVPME